MTLKGVNAKNSKKKEIVLEKDGRTDVQILFVHG